MNRHNARIGPLLAALVCLGTAAWAHTADVEASRSQLADIVAAIRAYTMQHDKLPPKLSILLDEGLADGPQSFVNPSGSTPLPRRAEVDEKGDYTLESPPSAPDAIVREKRPTHTPGKVLAGFKDGSIKLVDAPAETATVTAPAALPQPPPARVDPGTATSPGTVINPVSLSWIGFGADRVGVRGPASDGQPDAEFEIRYTRGDKLVQMVNLAMATPTGELCCQAWSSAGTQFHFLGVGVPGSGALGNTVGYAAQLGDAPETLRLYAAAPGWFAPGWRVVATVVFADGTYIAGSTVVGGGPPIQTPAVGLPVVGQESPAANSPALVGSWTIACCNEELKGTLSIAQQQGNVFSGTMSDPLIGEVTNGLVRGSVIEFDRSGGWGKQHWSGQLMNDRGVWRIVNGSWTGAYEERYPGRNNWHAEKK